MRKTCFPNTRSKHIGLEFITIGSNFCRHFKTVGVAACTGAHTLLLLELEKFYD